MRTELKRISSDDPYIASVNNNIEAERLLKYIKDFTEAEAYLVLPEPPSTHLPIYFRHPIPTPKFYQFRIGMIQYIAEAFLAGIRSQHLEH